MGNLCAGRDYETDGSSMMDRRSKQYAGMDMEVDAKGRAISTVGELGMLGAPPRIHRDRMLDKSKSVTHGVTQRNTPLKECSDEVCAPARPLQAPVSPPRVTTYGARLFAMATASRAYSDFTCASLPPSLFRSCCWPS